MAEALARWGGDRASVVVVTKADGDLLGPARQAAADYRQALHLLRSGLRPCMIFLDLMMPGVDGWEVLRTIRSEEATADLPVVLLTALGAVLITYFGLQAFKPPVLPD